MYISGFYLAAGLSSRMEGKRDKLLLPLLRGQVLEYSLLNLLASSVDEVIIVTGENPEIGKTVRQVLDAFTGEKNIVTLQNTRPELGMASSVKICMERCNSAADAFLFLLADMPFIGPEVIDKIAEHSRRNPGKNITPLYGGTRGHPVVISKRWRGRLMSGRGDFGGRRILRQYPEETVSLDFPSAGELLDVDTREDYKLALEHEMRNPPAGGTLTALNGYLGKNIRNPD